FALPLVVRGAADAVLAAQLDDRDAGFAFFEHRNDLAFGKSAFLQGSLRWKGGSEILPADVYSEGDPTARAGATLQAIWLAGQFQGVIKAQTPIGSLTTNVDPSVSWNANRLSTASAVSIWASPDALWASRASFAGAPISSEIASAISTKRFRYSSAILASKAARSSTRVFE